MTINIHVNNASLSIFLRELLSEFDYWQFWRNTADADVIRFLKIFTELPIEEIRKMETWEGAKLNDAKIILADEATSLLHGKECLPSIHETVKSLFQSGGANYDSLPKIALDVDMLDKVKSGGIPVVDVLIKASMATSKTEARKAIVNGGARVNDVKVSSESAVVTTKDFGSDGKMKLSLGKKKHVIFVLT
jgi:tyrosyl-tRNA synthetase